MAIASDRINQTVASLTERLGLRSVFTGDLMVLRTKLPRVARSDVPVLLRGGRGEQSERIARAVHYLSPRAGLPFIAIGCGRLTQAGLQRALFGRERTLTDLTEPSGLIRAAAGGTLFLDEVEKLDAIGQGRLLRWLREVGAEAVRIVCGTHTDLGSLVERECFRPDLYYRINVISLTLPPSGAN